MKSILIGGAAFLLNCAAYGIEEKDWVHTMPTEALPGTENLISLEPEEMAKHSVAITYALDRGRFGDQLVNYMKALWISWKYGLPILYRPFDYSDQLSLSSFHAKVFNGDTLKLFSKKVEFIHSIEKAKKAFEQFEKIDPSDEQLLCIISFLTPLDEKWEDEKWDDFGFRKLLQEQIKPKNQVPSLHLPKDRITVALHVRTGRGYDLQLNIDNMPTKFPSDTFYLNGLKQIADHFHGKPLYVYIFTDDPDPREIKNRLEEEWKDWEVENGAVFDCRLIENRHDLHVLEDFFSMMEFDCLIRPDSNFTRCIAAISAPLIEVKPSNWDEIRRDATGKPLKDKKGSSIVDPQIVYRSEKGGSIVKRRIVPIEACRLFTEKFEKEGELLHE